MYFGINIYIISIIINILYYIYVYINIIFIILDWIWKAQIPDKTLSLKDLLHSPAQLPNTSPYSLDLKPISQPNLLNTKPKCLNYPNLYQITSPNLSKLLNRPKPIKPPKILYLFGLNPKPIKPKLNP